MSTTLIFAIVSIVTALVFYTVGVWSEKISGRLKAWHTLLFWIGFVFDTTGTTLMTRLAGGMEFNLHGVTGVAAIVLMLTHAIWATLVLALKRESAIRNFHKFSIFVWTIWLIPFVSGMLGAMLR
jgi:uncharacterized repeat protein (TIGR03987 family)